MTLSNDTRNGAFGLPMRPLTRKHLVRALKKAQVLCQRGNVNRARRFICNALLLDVVLSRRLTRVNLGPDTKYGLSVLRRRWEISPVWKTAPTTAWKRSNRIASLLSKIAQFGSDANIVHSLERLSIFCWSMTSKDFSGLCHKIESRCDSIANVVSYFQTNNCLKQRCSLELSVEPKRQNLEKVVRNHQRKMNFSKYGVNHRPSTLGTAALLLTVLKRFRGLRPQIVLAFG